LKFLQNGRRFRFSQFAALRDSFLAVSITAIVENNTIRLPVHVPDGTQVEVVLTPDASPVESKPGSSFFDTIRDLMGSVDGPPDWAAEHDHYIHRALRASGL
jgi:hypothetical protein